MEPSGIRKWIWFIVGATVVAFFTIVIFIPNSGAPIPIKTLSVAPTEPRPIGIPVRLKIPKIGVNAAVEYVGVTPDGAMGIPSGPSTTAWFDLGPRPGEIGTAVIDGHFGWINNIPAVFDNLHTLQKGDILQVQDDKGVVINFVVREVRTYGQNQTKDAFGALGPSDGKAHLNLITCEGIWSASQKSYADRLIVFADAE